MVYSFYLKKLIYVNKVLYLVDKSCVFVLILHTKKQLLFRVSIIESSKSQLTFVHLEPRLPGLPGGQDGRAPLEAVVPAHLQRLDLGQHPQPHLGRLPRGLHERRRRPRTPGPPGPGGRGRRRQRGRHVQLGHGGGDRPRGLRRPRVAVHRGRGGQGPPRAGVTVHPAPVLLQARDSMEHNFSLEFWHE